MGELLETFFIGGTVAFVFSLLFSFFRDQSDEDEPNPKPASKSPSSKTDTPYSSLKSETSILKSRDLHAMKRDPISGTRYSVIWGDAYKSHNEYVYGDEPHDKWFAAYRIDRFSFDSFLFQENLDYKDLRFNPRLTLRKYDEWVKSPPGRFAKSQNTKPITPTHSRETIQETVTMYDFFTHPLYKEFETREGISLKDTKLEVLQIYKLFKAYLLLNHNIEITTKDL